MLGWDARVWSGPLADPAYRNEVWERILANIIRTASGCWEWQLWINRDGYGVVSVKRRMTYVHQVAKAIQLGGPWPTPLQIDHLCRNRCCCNPEHLEVVTPLENSRRSTAVETIKAIAAASSNCRYGHAWTEENTHWKVYKGGRSKRVCRACERISYMTPVTCPDCGKIFARSNLRRHRAGRNCIHEKPTCGFPRNSEDRASPCNSPVDVEGDRCWHHREAAEVAS